MGLTIHYQLRSDTQSVNRARDLVTRLRKRAMDLPFENVEDLIELSDAESDYQQYEQDHPYRPQQIIGEAVFCCVDSITAREAIWRSVKPSRNR